MLAAGFAAHFLHGGPAAEHAECRWDSPRSPAGYLAGYLWAVTGGLSSERPSVLLPTARPEFGVKGSWNYKVLTLLSMSTLITAGLGDLQIQKRLEHTAHAERHPAICSHTQAELSPALLQHTPMFRGTQGPREPPTQPSLCPAPRTSITGGGEQSPSIPQLNHSAQAQHLLANPCHKLVC